MQVNYNFRIFVIAMVQDFLFMPLARRGFCSMKIDLNHRNTYCSGAFLFIKL